MIYRIWVTLAVLLLACSLLPKSLAKQTNVTLISSAKTAAELNGKIPGCYIVAFKKNIKEGNSNIQASIAQASVKNAVRAFGRITEEFGGAMNGFTVCGVKSKNQMKSLQTHPQVSFMEQDQIVKSLNLQTVNNPLSWGLDRIDQRSNTLDKKFIFNGAKGSQVNVYIVDTGIRLTHSEFENRASYGYNSIDRNNNAEDCEGHGTHCAGTVGGKTYGVCKQCKLIGVKVLDCSGRGTVSGLIAGINWVISDVKKTKIPSVMSLSLGTGFSQSLNDMISSAVNAGIVSVVAAGNEGESACLYSPASAPSAITVGATSISGLKSEFSNHGSCVDIFAPGQDITSAWIGSDSRIETISGTSMAAPHVAGVAAIYRSYNPSKSASQVAEFLIQTTSTLNAIPNLDPYTPNRLVYSQTNALNRVVSSISYTRRNFTLSTSSTSSNRFSSLFWSSTTRQLNGFLEFSAPVAQLDLDLYLEQRIGSRWVAVTSSEGSTNTEFVSTRITSGTYRWRINVYQSSISSSAVSFHSTIPVTF
jgi:subtilisin family serine protease